MTPIDHPVLTYISATLKGATKVMSEKEREQALDCFQHWRQQCRHLAPEAPENVAYTLHVTIDEHVEHMRSRTKHEVQCRKGCASCCHLNVDIFTQEAKLLLMLAREQGIEIDWERVERQAAKNSANWRELSIEDQACVFLAGDRTCRVYEHRPGACRKYLVATDPDLCDQNKYPGGDVGVVFDTQAEIVHSAAMTVFGAGPMAEMLLAVRKEETQ